MKHGSTLFLRGIVVFIGLTALVVCFVVLPYTIHAEISGDFDYLPILLGLYLPAVPFFIALQQALKLLSYIDNNKAFSKLSVRALRYIKYCAFTVSVLFVAGIPYIFYLAERDDAPGIAAAGFVIAGASLVIATAAGLFQQVFQSAVDIQAENDLTV